MPWILVGIMYAQGVRDGTSTGTSLVCRQTFRCVPICNVSLQAPKLGQSRHQCKEEHHVIDNEEEEVLN